MAAPGRLKRGRRVSACRVILLLAGLVLASPCLVRLTLAAEGDIRGAVRAVGLANSELGESVLDARLDFEAEAGHFIIGGTWRAYELSSELYNPGQVYPDPLGIRHRYMEFNTEDFSLRAGHFFTTFGRGLVLRSFEEMALEHDTALDGILGEYSAGPFELTGVAGGMSGRTVDTRNQSYNVYGMRAFTHVWDMVRLGTSALKRFDRKSKEGVPLPDSLSSFDDAVLGADAEAWVGPLTLSSEYVRREGDYNYLSEQSGEPGYGTYVGAAYAGSWLSVLAEYKNYYRFENALINPPTCVKEHVYVLMNRVTHLVHLNDERGYMLEGVISLPEDMTITAGASEARMRNHDLLHWEMFSQIDYIRSDLLSASMGLSWSREYDRDKYTQHITGAMDSDISMADQVVEVTFEIQGTEEPSGDKFTDLLASISYYPRYDMTVVGMAEFTTRADVSRDTWVFVDLRLSIGENYEVSLGGGTERGGKKCAGGICFDELEFTGLRARFLAYF